MASVLDAHRTTLTVHEPFKSGLLRVSEWLKEFHVLDQEGQKVAIEEFWERLQKPFTETLRPPFFKKDFLASSVGRQTLAWQLAAKSSQLQGPFRNAMKFKDGSEPGVILAKDTIGQKAGEFVNALNAQALILVRNPYSCVNSVLRGVQNGKMKGVDGEGLWNNFRVQMIELGFAKEKIRDSSRAFLETIRWGIWNRVYYTLASQGEGHKVVRYEEMFVRARETADEILGWLGVESDVQLDKFLVESTTMSKSNLGHRLKSLSQLKSPFHSIVRTADQGVDRMELLDQKQLDEVKRALEVFPELAEWADYHQWATT